MPAETHAARSPVHARVAAGGALALLLLLVLLLSWPQALSASRVPGVAQLVAFRAVLAFALGFLAAILGVVALIRRKKLPVIVLTASIVLAAGSIVNAGVLLSRGSGSEPLPDGDLVVMAWNAQGGATPPGEIARAAADARVDVLSLPETDEDAAAEVARLLAEEGIDTTPHTVGDRTGIPTSILIADRLGDYRLDLAAGSTPGLPSGVWRREDGDGPATIVAAHPMPPLPATMTQWWEGLDWVAGVCDSSDVIVAGDLNATVDHFSGLGVDGHLVGECDDAASASGGGAAGTWPSSAPAWMSAPIDHVLHGSSWRGRGASVLPAGQGGSDHRAIVVVLDRR